MAVWKCGVPNVGLVLRANTNNFRANTNNSSIAPGAVLERPRLPELPRAALRGTTRKRRVAVDTAGNVYVTDGNHNRVLKFPAG
jgi:hypothetical protein